MFSIENARLCMFMLFICWLVWSAYCLCDLFFFTLSNCIMPHPLWSKICSFQSSYNSSGPPTSEFCTRNGNGRVEIGEVGTSHYHKGISQEAYKEGSSFSKEGIFNFITLILCIKPQESKSCIWWDPCPSQKCRWPSVYVLIILPTWCWFLCGDYPNEGAYVYKGK